MSFRPRPLTEHERILGCHHTQADLQAAFDLVEPADHWKDPIDATLSDEEIGEVGGWSVIQEAVLHFTATAAIRTDAGNTLSGYHHWRIQAAGYWAGPAA